MQSCLQAARYEIRFAADSVDREVINSSIDELLARETLDWEEQRGEKTRRYDIRATILALAVEASEDGGTLLSMHLSLEEGRTGRPAQVLVALGVEAEPTELVRASLELSEAAGATG